MICDPCAYAGDTGRGEYHMECDNGPTGRGTWCDCKHYPVGYLVRRADPS